MAKARIIIDLDTETKELKAKIESEGVAPTGVVYGAITAILLAATEEIRDDPDAIVANVTCGYEALQDFVDMIAGEEDEEGIDEEMKDIVHKYLPTDGDKSTD